MGFWKAAWFVARAWIFILILFGIAWIPYHFLPRWATLILALALLFLTCTLLAMSED
jgi:cell division protein FtsW (lipid II flippase)